MAKSRGKDGSQDTAKANKESLRILNIGVPVTVGGVEYRVREPGLLEFASFMLDAADIFMAMEQHKDNPLQFLAIAAQHERVRSTISKLFGSLCGAPAENFENLTVTEGLALLKAAKEVLDFEEIKKGFFDLGLGKFLPIQITTESQ